MAFEQRSWILLPAAALALAALTGCDSSGTAASDAGHPARPSSAGPSPSASASLPAAAPGGALADPLPDRLPLGTKVVLQRTGTGAQPLDLTGLVGSKDEVTVHWLCAGGTDGVQVTDRSATVVGSDCSATPDQASAVFTGVVPPSSSRDLSWKLRAGPNTAWRIAVTVGS